jgi:hypothetical protein
MERLLERIEHEVGPHRGVQPAAVGDVDRRTGLNLTGSRRPPDRPRMPDRHQT